MQTENLYCLFVWIRDHMSSYNLPSVTQSLFPRPSFTIICTMWNIPSPFLDHRRSYFKPGVCTEFTNLIKEDVDVNEVSLSNI